MEQEVEKEWPEGYAEGPGGQEVLTLPSTGLEEEDTIEGTGNILSSNLGAGDKI